jgi:hypothetical protein
MPIQYVRKLCELCLEQIELMTTDDYGNKPLEQRVKQKGLWEDNFHHCTRNIFPNSCERKAYLSPQLMTLLNRELNLQHFLVSW